LPVVGLVDDDQVETRLFARPISTGVFRKADGEGKPCNFPQGIPNESKVGGRKYWHFWQHLQNPAPRVRPMPGKFGLFRAFAGLDIYHRQSTIHREANAIC